MILLSVTGIIGKRTRRSPDRLSGYYSPDAPCLSYRRLAGAKAIFKLGSCDKHPAYCYEWNVDKWHIHNDIN